MRLSDFSFLSNAQTPPKPSISSVLSGILPPDPKAPETPTIPPPTCGTLPAATLLEDLLGGSGKPGR
jgi:hypothetical protein